MCVVGTTCSGTMAFAHTPALSGSAVELQLNHNGQAETMKQSERGNGFIRSLPEFG